MKRDIKIAEGSALFIFFESFFHYPIDYGQPYREQTATYR